MTADRVVSILMLIGSVYGGVWSAIYEPGLIPVFAFLVICSAWTVSVMWDQVSESE